MVCLLRRWWLIFQLVSFPINNIISTWLLRRPSYHHRPWRCAVSNCINTGWRRCIGCLKLQVSFRKRATNYRFLLRKMTTRNCLVALRKCLFARTDINKYSLMQQNSIHLYLHRRWLCVSSITAPTSAAQAPVNVHGVSAVEMMIDLSIGFFSNKQHYL